MELNPEKPRRLSFNFTVKVDDKKTQVWDGRTRGPPRKDKWPDKEELVKLIKDAL